MAEKIKNLRNIPTSSEVFQDKKFSIEVFMMLQIESNWNDIDKYHRYICTENINYTQWAKHTNLSIPTIRKNMRYFEEIGIIKKYKGANGFMYYKILNKFDKHRLMEERFLRKLTNIGSKNLIKIYLTYYNYTEAYGSCCLTQEKILKQIGLSVNSNNKQMVTDINHVLEDLGLIVIDKTYEYKKTYLTITAIPYYETKFYKDRVKITSGKREGKTFSFLL